MLFIPLFLTNKAVTSVYPGKNKRKGNPRITRGAVDGMKAMDRIRRTERMSIINISFNILSFNTTPCI